MIYSMFDLFKSNLMPYIKINIDCEFWKENSCSTRGTWAFQRSSSDNESLGMYMNFPRERLLRWNEKFPIQDYNFTLKSRLINVCNSVLCKLVPIKLQILFNIVFNFTELTKNNFGNNTKIVKINPYSLNIIYYLWSTLKIFKGHTCN